MAAGTDTYQSPLCGRYASLEARKLFSDDVKFSTWRKLWVALAESEKELGLPITDEQIAELHEHIYDINYDTANEREKEVRHDVMAHVYAYGRLCPKAAGIIHLGATSCFVGDNTDIIVMKQALKLTRGALLSTIKALRDFAEKYKGAPTLAYTHFQPAQPTTVGKRAALWLNDLIMDLDNLDHCARSLKLLGCKGTTGTCASFLELFNGDSGKVHELERKICEKMGFHDAYPVSGQTYSRKVDFFVLSALSGIAQSAHKFANDFRLLSHLREFDEPFEAGQIGSSAMAYKRNPMRCERITSLARYVMADLQNPAMTAAEQWFERTLDDSANKRISIAEAFLATDAILSLYSNVIANCRVFPKIIERHMLDEMPFMATENILMRAVGKGGDRQQLHESIRRHSLETLEGMKLRGERNNLTERIAADPIFRLTESEIEDIIKNGAFTGLAAEQTEEYLKTAVNPLLEANKDQIAQTAQINV